MRGDLVKSGKYGVSFGKSDAVKVPSNTHQAPGTEPLQDAAHALSPHHIAFALIKRPEGVQVVKLRLTPELIDQYAIQHWPADVPENAVWKVGDEVEKHIEGGWR